LRPGAREVTRRNGAEDRLRLRQNIAMETVVSPCALSGEPRCAISLLTLEKAEVDTHVWTTPVGTNLAYALGHRPHEAVVEVLKLRHKVAHRHAESSAERRPCWHALDLFPGVVPPHIDEVSTAPERDIRRW